MDHGRLLFEYRGPRVHPILYAAAIVFAFVWATGSIENALREGRSQLYVIYAIPLVCAGLAMAVTWRRSVRIFQHGVGADGLLWSWRHSFVSWKDIHAAYPVPYDVTGAFVSPFASSDGKVTQTGIRFELVGGGTATLRFTPSRFLRGVAQSKGFRQAWPIIEQHLGSQGRPPVPVPLVLSGEETQRILAAARKPFLPFGVIVALFAAAAPALWVLVQVGVAVPVALCLALALPVGTSTRSWWASRRRMTLLAVLGKAQQWERQQALAPASLAPETKGGAT